MYEAAAKKAYSRFGLSYTAMHILYIAALMVFAAIGQAVTDGSGLPDQTRFIINYSFRFIVIYPLMLFSVSKLPVFEIRKKKLGFGGFIACVAITYTLSGASNALGMFINSKLGKITGAGAVNPLIDTISDISPLTMFIIAGILAPVFEELLFRKYLIDRVVNYGEVLAMVMSGVMFGLYHGNFAQFSYAMVIGMFFAFIYIRTGKIGYTIGIHMIINSVSTFLTKVSLGSVDISEMMGYLTNGDQEAYMEFVNAHMMELMPMMSIGMFFLFVLFIGLILIIVLHKKFVFEHHEEEIEKGRKFKTAVLNPGMIIYMVFWIGSIVLTQLGVTVYDRLYSLLGLN